MKKCCFIGFLAFLAFMFFGRVCAQSGAADSLIRYLSVSDIPDSVRIKVLGDISWELMGSDISSSLKYAEEELKLATRVNRTADIAQAESDIGNVFNRMASYDSALAHYENGLKLRKQLKQTEKIAGIQTNIATVYMRQNKFSKALVMNFSTLRIFEASGDIVKQANVLGNIGNIYYELKQNKSAEDFLRRALVLAEKGNAPVPMGNILVNIGGVKFDQLQLDSALYYYARAEKIMTDNKLLYNLAAVQNNIGKIWLEKKDYDKAIRYYELAIKNRTELNDVLGVALCQMNLGEAYLYKGEIEKAQRSLLPAEKSFLELNAYIQLKQVYDFMARAYEMKGDHKKANEYFRLHAAYKDSVYTKDNSDKMAEMVTRFQTEKKDLEIAKQNAEIEFRNAEIRRKNTINLVLIISVLLVVFLSWLLYNRHTLKQRTILAAELLKQQEIRARAVIEAEEKERMRIARDLHDGIGQTLSAAKMNLSSLENKLQDRDGETQDLLKNSLELIDDSVKEVRSVSHSMMPNALLKLGLAAAVREFIHKISAAGQIKIELEINGLNERLEASTETVLFRVLQEIVSNVIRHADANTISIQIIKHDDEITMMVEDNGKGFDTSNIGEAAGIGLKNIITRVQYLNGTVDYDSAPGRGTTVTIEVPYGDKTKVKS